MRAQTLSRGNGSHQFDRFGPRKSGKLFLPIRAAFNMATGTLQVQVWKEHQRAFELWRSEINPRMGAIEIHLLRNLCVLNSHKLCLMST